MSWYDTNWKYKKTIEINSGSIVGTAIQLYPSVPMIFQIVDDTVFTSRAKPDGLDIIFTDKTDTVRIPHEIVNYDAVLGNMSVWVRVPNLEQDTYQAVNMYYGNPAVSVSYEDTASLWYDYRLVLHLSSYKGRLLRDSCPRPHSAGIISRHIHAGVNPVTPISGSESKLCGGVKFDITFPVAGNSGIGSSGSIFYSGSDYKTWAQNAAESFQNLSDGYWDNDNYYMINYWVYIPTNQLSSITADWSLVHKVPYSLAVYFSRTGYFGTETSSSIANLNFYGTSTWGGSSGGNSQELSIYTEPHVPMNKGEWHQHGFLVVGGSFYSTLDGSSMGGYSGMYGTRLSASISIGSPRFSGSVEEIKICSSVLTTQRILTEYYNQKYADSYTVSQDIPSPLTQFGQTNMNLQVINETSSFSMLGGSTDLTISSSQRILKVSVGDVTLVGSSSADEYILPTTTSQLAAIGVNHPFISNQTIGSTGAFTISSSIYYQNMIRMTTSPYTMSYTDTMLHVSTSRSSMSVKLPASLPGQTFIIKDFNGSSSYAAGSISSSRIIVSASTTQTIDGQPAFILSSSYQATTFVGDGNNWYTI